MEISKLGGERGPCTCSLPENADTPFQWCGGVVIITTTQLHLSKPVLMFCGGSNPARSMSEIHDGEDL